MICVIGLGGDEASDIYPPALVLWEPVLAGASPRDSAWHVPQRCPLGGSLVNGTLCPVVRSWAGASTQGVA